MKTATPYAAALSEADLIEHYAPLVRRQALSLCSRLPASVDADDLMQAGLMGLLDAVRRYQQQAGASFETYAVSRIRGAMYDELRAMDWLPRSVRSKSRQLETAIQALVKRLSRPPTEGEIAAELELSLDDYHRLLEDAQGMQIVMFDDLGRGEDSHPDDYWLKDKQPGPGFDPVSTLLRDDLRGVLVQAIQQLPEREKQLLSLQFERDLNQKEIAAVLGLTEGRISQIRSQAVARIRAFLVSHDWDSAEEAGGYQGLM